MDEEIAQRKREVCPMYRKIGCCGENQSSGAIIDLECPDNNACPYSTK